MNDLQTAALQNLYLCVISGTHLLFSISKADHTKTSGAPQTSSMLPRFRGVHGGATSVISSDLMTAIVTKDEV